LIAGVLWLILEFTDFGAQLRAAVDNPRMARCVGIDVPWVFSITFAVGCGLGSLKGSFYSALVLGLVDTFGRYYVPAAGAFVIYFAVLVLLLWRPQGVFARA